MRENDFIFTQDNGERLYPSTYTGWLREILKVAGIDHCSLHSIRHTNITMQIAAGVPLVTVAARVGHARASTTSDIYAHFIKSSDKSAAVIIDKVFNSEPQQAPVSEDIQSVIEAKKDLPAEPSNENDTVKDFKFIKAEMQRLGFDSYDEYEEYLNFIARKKQQRK